MNNELIKHLRILANSWREVSPHVNANGHLMVAADQLDGVLSNFDKQPCGHPLSAIVTNGTTTTSYCGSCADESLQKNINEGVEA